MEYYTFIDPENVEAGLVARDPGVSIRYFRWEMPIDNSDSFALADFSEMSFIEKSDDEYNVFDDMDDEIVQGEKDPGGNYMKLDKKNDFFKAIFQGGLK